MPAVRAFAQPTRRVRTEHVVGDRFCVSTAAERTTASATKRNLRRSSAAGALSALCETVFSVVEMPAELRMRVRWAGVG
jgi:hypothetical protein